MEACEEIKPSGGEDEQLQKWLFSLEKSKKAMKEAADILSEMLKQNINPKGKNVTAGLKIYSMAEIQIFSLKELIRRTEEAERGVENG